jgi:uncharacterized protein with NRDE domain
MCTILFAWRWRDDEPAVLAANRDELLARPSGPPRRLREHPELWGGVDLVSGGTWLAVDPAGRLCAVTNRHLSTEPEPPDPARRSRGELPLLALGAGPDGDDAALRVLASMSPTDYNPVNVLYLSAGAARWVASDDVGGRTGGDVAPGVHALTVRDLDDETDAKTQRLLRLAREAAQAAVDADDLRQHLEDLLRSHEQDAGSAHTAACIHGEEYGTVSSASVVLDPGEVEFRHAQGRPCETEHRAVLGASVQPR